MIGLLRSWTVSVPVLAVLGNHDFEKGRHKLIRQILHNDRVHILDADGHIEELPTMRKETLADHILDRIQPVVAQRAQGVA